MTLKHARCLAVLLATSLTAGNAFGYCRTTTCAKKVTKGRTLPPECLDETLWDASHVCHLAGIPLYWPTNCLSYSVNSAGSPKLGITATALEQLLRRTFDNWQNASCVTGGVPNIRVATYPQVTCDKVAYNHFARNQNVVLFRDDVWPHPDQDAESTLALTSVKFDEKGVILDADLEINSTGTHVYTLETRPSNGTADLSGLPDLPSIIQHETGHFLGLAHSPVPTATMLAQYTRGMETLDPDDVAGICAAYPPNPAAPLGCDPSPANGFTPVCETDPKEKACACVVPGARTSKNQALFRLLWLAPLALLRRRRRSSQQ